MSNIKGCISISDKSQTAANVAGAVSVIAGLALAILAQTAAQYFHTKGVYFFAPGVALAGVALLAVVLVNCCRKEREEESQSEASPWVKDRNELDSQVARGKSDNPFGLTDSDLEDNSDSEASPSGQHQKNNGQVAEDTRFGAFGFDDKSDSEAEDAVADPHGRRPSSPPASDTLGFLRGHSLFMDPLLQAAIAASMEDLAPAIQPAEYQIQVGPYDGKKPTDMVAPPRDVKGVYEKIPGENKQDPKQCAYLDKIYRYQVVQGKGDCLYIAFISGFLHHMVATKTSDNLKTQLAWKCWNFASREQHHRARAVIDSIRNKDSLIACLLDKERFNELIQYFRTVAATKAGNSDIQRMGRYADEGEVLTLSELLGGGLCITPEHSDYSRLAGAQGVFHRHPGNFLVICRPNHYDLLIPRKTLIQLGLDTP